MICRINGVAALLKKGIPTLFIMQCVIHLIATNLDSNLFDSLDIIIKFINKIKRNSLHEPIFKSLCENYNEDYNKLLLHTTVRWLSKRKFVIRFHKLYNIS